MSGIRNPASNPELLAEGPPLVDGGALPVSTESNFAARNYYNEALGRSSLSSVIGESTSTQYGPGFQIERIAKEGETPSSFPVTEVLAAKEDRIDYLKEGLQNGAIRLIEEREAIVDEAVFSGMAFASVQRKEYEEAVQVGSIREASQEVLDGEFMYPTEAKEKGWDAFFAQKKAEAWDFPLGDYVDQHPAGYETLPNEVRRHLTDVTEAFDLEVFGQVRKLYNFSERKLTDKQLAQVCNGLRSAAQRSGGGVLDKLNTITILPGHDEDTLESRGAWDLYWRGGITAVAEEDNPSDPKHGNVCINSFYLKEGNLGVPGKSVGAGTEDRFEAVIVHELAHINAFGHNIVGSKRENVGHFGQQVGWTPKPDMVNLYDKKMHDYGGPNEPVTPYAATNSHEDEAETTTALHFGGDTAERVSDDRLAAMEETWAATHAGNEGPAYVRCRELDLEAARKQGRKVGLENDRPTEMKIVTYFKVER